MIKGSMSYYMPTKTAPSPNGRDMHASHFKIGSIEKGYDGNNWIVAEKTNGSHFWKKM